MSDYLTRRGRTVTVRNYGNGDWLELGVGFQVSRADWGTADVGGRMNLDWSDYWEDIGCQLYGLAEHHEMTIIVRHKTESKSVTIVPEHLDRLEALLQILVEWSEKHG